MLARCLSTSDRGRGRGGGGGGGGGGRVENVQEEGYIVRGKLEY